MSQSQNLLLVLSGALMAAALLIKRMPLSENAAVIVGLVEVLVAVGVGFAFGFARKRGEKRP